MLENEQKTGLETFQYDNTTVRNFLIATTIFGVIGMTVGLLVASNLFFRKPTLDCNTPPSDG